MAEESAYKVYRSRWMTLALLIPIIVASEVLWLTFAPIEAAAVAFYGVSSFEVSLFSLSYMVMYIFFTIPASYVIEKYGFRTSVIIGTALTVVFGAARFFFADVFIIAMIAQFGVAIGQPFLVNISTKVPANWFPEKERATASGLLVMAQYLGMIIAMIGSTVLFETLGDIKVILGIYAAFAVAAAVPALFAKEKPTLPPGPEAPKESMAGMWKLFRNGRFTYVLIISFIAMGLFNTIMTKVDQIFTPRGADPGLVGAIFVISGVVGAVVLPLLSDKLCKRVPFFMAGVTLMSALIICIMLFSGFTVMAAVCAALGFTVMGLAPILFQHGAEVAYPVQEGASFGLIMLMGQVSGIIFVVLFELIQGESGGLMWPMLFLIALSLVQIPFAARMKESAVLMEMRRRTEQKG